MSHILLIMTSNLWPRLCLAMVPSERFERLRSLDPTRYRWTLAHAWPDVMPALRARSVDIAILDPLAQGEEGVAFIEEIRRRFPSIPILIYTTLSAAMAPVLLRLGQAGIRRVIFALFEDAPGTLRQALNKEFEWSNARQVSHALREALGALPEKVRLALEASLSTPDHRATVATFAEHAHLSVYECHQLFIEAELPSPRTVMTLARLLYAHRLLLDPGHTIDDVARKLGYKRSRRLQVQLQAVFHQTGAKLRSSLSPADATRIIVHEHLRPRARPTRTAMAIPDSPHTAWKTLES